MKFAYFTIHPGKNPPPENGCRLKSVVFSKALVYTKCRLDPEIGMHAIQAS
jgi:hypothetical protein